MCMKNICSVVQNNVRLLGHLVYVYEVQIYREYGTENAIAKRRERNQVGTEGAAMEERLFCNMLIFNDPGRNSLRSTYLLNGAV